MSLTLHEAFVPSCHQILNGMRGLIDKGEAHVRDNGLEDSELIEASLAEGMWALPWHVRACWVHSGYTLGLIPSGEFTPDFTDVPKDWDAMRAMVDDALSRLDATSAQELEAIAGQTTGFVLGGKRLMEMTAQNFLLSFNQPNFYFHATTFYDILRMKGLPLGKMDFMGPIRVLGS
ncbi:MAG: DUF1993 domain-containing protein [Erythrobacter sp.]|nr:DUF1993 domain-containing protein [Erythrobacter sp.]